MHFLKNGWLPGLLVALLTGCQPAAPVVRTETRTATSGSQYTIFYPDKLRIQVVTSRPQPETGPYSLAVAAAYTDLNTDKPLDLLVCQGQALQPRATVGFLDGELTIVDTTLTISRLAPGQTPPAAQLARVRRRQGTVLLQELLVFQGQNQRPAGGSRFQRRALVELPARRFVVIESASDSLTMRQFAADLIQLGARNALYLDMGGWDEGWYAASDGVRVLGHRRSDTSRQSNWLVFGPSR